MLNALYLQIAYRRNEHTVHLYVHNIYICIYMECKAVKVRHPHTYHSPRGTVCQDFLDRHCTSPALLNVQCTIIVTMKMLQCVSEMKARFQPGYCQAV